MVNATTTHPLMLLLTRALTELARPIIAEAEAGRCDSRVAIMQIAAKVMVVTGCSPQAALLSAHDIATHLIAPSATMEPIRVAV